MKNKRVAYFGTLGNAGHSFEAINGYFSPEEEKEIEKIDSDAIYSILNKYCFDFFLYGKYGCLGFPASPDDERGGCKTVVFVENTSSKNEIIDVVNAYPFLRKQFERLSLKFNVPMPIKEDFNEKQ